MDYIWHDYCPEQMGFVESWLDPRTVKFTGLDEGFCAFYEYWAQEDGFYPGENFWCKVVFEGNIPIAIIAFCFHEGKLIIMEVLVAPEKRGQGIGTKLLAELLIREEILGFPVQESEAVIFPGNAASQKAFERAGFQCRHVYEDGSAMLYSYRK